ncbi:MAG: single-stranded DNA-binding protein [Oscillospiraceae bacterium]|nr:single-stranded DNA-binding protein [Oscillospiraceae bacterium]
MNSVVLMGRLVNDPEFSVAQTGTPMCRFRVAVDRPVQGGQKQSDFFSVVCFRKTAEFVNQYFVKGKPILIEGRIQNDNYTDKNGTQHYGQQIVANNVSFVLSDPTRNNNNQSFNNGGYQNYGNTNNYGYGGGNYYSGQNYGNGGNNGYNANNYGNGGNNGYNANNYNNGGNNGYNANNYNNGNSYPAGDQQNAAPMLDNPPKDVQLGDSDISDFEEIISDGQVPF